MKEKKHQKIIVVLGPTATGKTKLAVHLANKFNGEIISADSRQVFKGMDIGTGKDLGDYKIKKGKKEIKIPYHLIDIISPKTSFNVAKYQKLATSKIKKIQTEGKLPILAGGTGLYLDSIIYGYDFSKNVSEKKVKEIRKKLDKLTLSQLLIKLKKIDPKSFETIDKKNRRRVQRALEIYYQTGEKKSIVDRKITPNYDFLILGVKFPLDKIYEKIKKRLKERIKEGMIEEVKNLHQQGVSWKRMEEFGLEYRYVSRYLRDLLNKQEMIEQLEKEICHFAKRQITWFKRNDQIIWLEGNNLKQKIIQAEKLVKKII